MIFREPVYYYLAYIAFYVVFLLFFVRVHCVAYVFCTIISTGSLFFCCIYDWCSNRQMYSLLTVIFFLPFLI